MLFIFATLSYYAWRGLQPFNREESCHITADEIQIPHEYYCTNNTCATQTIYYNPIKSSDWPGALNVIADTEE